MRRIFPRSLFGSGKDPDRSGYLSEPIIVYSTIILCSSVSETGADRLATCTDGVETTT